MASEALALVALARAAWLLGREEEAFEAAMEALHLSRQSGCRRGEARALQILAPMAREPAAQLQLCSEAGAVPQRRLLLSRMAPAPCCGPHGAWRPWPGARPCCTRRSS